jgi:ceramide glucosyltransferase
MPFKALAIIGFIMLAVAAFQTVLTLIAVLVWRRRVDEAGAHALPAVTIMKPLCGAEPQLYEHLRSFCEQDFGQFQVVFGLRETGDPALAIVDRIRRDFPGVAIDVVINAQQHGNNYKISNLINMLGRAKYDVLVFADSDTFVGRDYLSTVTAPLLDPGIGLVTCLYRGVPAGNIWSRLAAMYINEWYMPTVLLAWLFGYQGYASGQTICVRRQTLEALGGLPQVVNHLADDHRLGELVRNLGLRILMSRYPVSAEHDEPSLRALVRHEQRWMRTIRAIRPRSYSMLFLSFGLPLSAVGILLVALLAPNLAYPAWLLFLIVVASRVGLHVLPRWRSGGALLADLSLLPLRDFLILWVWVRALFASRVIWRGNAFNVDAEGVMRRGS